MIEDHADTGPARSVRLEPEIAAANPWADDVLDRQSTSVALTNLVTKQKGPFVISLHGKWGTGKTFFLKRWQRQLDEDGHRAVYFNAWKNDFCSDPLIAMIAALDIPEASRSRVAEYVKVITYQNMASLVKHHTGLQISNIDDDILKSYEHQKSIIDRLRNDLIKFLKKEGPLIYIIDELDRCRPDFAIATLERTKHVLDIPGLVFVYGINRHDMCESLKSLYGSIDVDVYLRRFFDMEFKLPVASNEMFCKHLVNHYRISEMLQTSVNGNYANGFVEAATSIPSAIKTLSLRDIDQCLAVAALAASNMAQGKIGLSPFVIMAIIVSRLINRDLYQRFVDGDHVAGELLTTLEMQVDDSVLANRYSWLRRIAAPLYAICDKSVPHGGMTALNELITICEEHEKGKKMPPTKLLAESTRSDVDGLREMISDIERGRRIGELRKRYLVALIEMID